MLKSFSSDGQWAWDATSLTLTSECLRKYYYRLIANIAPATPSVHLMFGGVYASCLETYHRLVAKGESREDALRTIVRKALVDTYDYAEDGSPIGPKPFLDECKTRVSLVRSLVWYIDQYAQDEEDGLRTYFLQDGTPAVELSFLVEFAEDISWAGHYDRAVRYGNGVYWSDQKTTKSALTPHYFSSLTLTNQFMGYTWAGKIVLDSPISGGIIDAAQIGANFTRFSRSPVTYNNAQLEEWRESALYHIAHAREAYRQGAFPQNFSSCGNYGGCPYRSLCSKSPMVREQFILADFIHPEPWDPAVPRGE